MQQRNSRKREADNVVALAPARPVRLPGLTVDTVPHIGDILSHRGIWILATLTRDGRHLKGTHYCIVLVGGKTPMWGIWTINGKFLRFAESRHEIERAYPNHVWRRHPARWVFDELAPKATIERRNYMLTKFGEGGGNA